MSNGPSFCTMQVKEAISATDLKRIHLAYEYIENNLEKDILVDDIARAVNVSPYHFHRIFSKFVSVPVLKFVNQWRMERAARQIVYMKHLSVTEIAHMNGYSSSANFARAFKSYFGVSAGEIRRVGFISVTDFDNNAPSRDEMDKYLEALDNVSINKMPSYTTVGYIGRDGYTTESITDARRQLSNWIDDHKDIVDINKQYDYFFESICVYPEEKRRYCTVVKINKMVEITEPYSYFCIRKGNYARVNCPVPLLKSSALVELFLTQWLKENNCMSIGAPMAKFDPDDQSGYWLFRIKELR